MTKTKKNKTLEKSQVQTSETLNFSLALTRVAVAHICQSVGYASAKSSALQTLTSVAGLYLKNLTNLAAERANRFGRTESNLLDVVVALEDLGSVKGFKGGSDLNKGLLKSLVLWDLVDFVDRVDEIPFAQSIRRLKYGSFGVVSESSLEDNVGGGGGIGVGSVPIWLPRFPDIKTYKEDDDECKGGRFGNGEVLFPNGGVKGVSASGNVEVGKRGCGGELRANRCRVKFRFGAKRKSGMGVGADVNVCGETVFIGGAVGVSSDECEKEKKQILNETESVKLKNVYVRRGLLLKNGAKRIVQRRKEVV